MFGQISLQFLELTGVALVDNMHGRSALEHLGRMSFFCHWTRENGPDAAYLLTRGFSQRLCRLLFLQSIVRPRGKPC
jgi:hypothetical protein